MDQYDKKDALIELFGMLRDSVNKDVVATDKLINQQFELVTQIKALPIKELNDALKEHAKESVKEIDNCSGAIELKTNEILEKCKELTFKINKIFWAVGIAIVIATTGYIAVRATVDNKATFQEWKKEITHEREETIHELKNEIIKEMQKLHQNDNKTSEGN